jgi:ectoine hydroxylase-related dioxygenase (phytanoyl-CoA dioxygenase family)
LRDFDAALAGESWCNIKNDEDEAESDTFFGLKTKRLHGLAGVSHAFESVLLDPLVLAMALRVLDTQRVIMSTAELMAIGSGEVKQALHRDGDSWHRVPRPHGELLFSINVALTDFTEDNGATVVVPGSHQWERDRQPCDEETTRATMRQRSALFYVGNVIHSGGHNDAEATRTGMYVGYIPSWLRPIENSHVTVDPEAWSQLRPETRALLGYAPGGFALTV